MSPAKSIGIIAPPWVPVPPPGYGGTEAVVDQLAVGFQRAGHKVVLYTTGDSTCPVPRDFVFTEVDPNRMGAPVTEVRHVMHAYEALQNLDIVHDHTLLGPVYAERFPELPVVTTNHGPFDEDLTDIYGRIAHRVPIIAISQAQADVASRHLPIAKTIHHGVDPECFPFGLGDAGYSLFLGRLSPDKGAHRAVAVAQSAGVPLLMAGKMRAESEREYFETRVRPHLDETTWYLGEVSHERKLELLAGASCLLFPIRWPEPFGMVMIEAMACGTPVLAFPEGAAPEVVDHGRTGFLCGDEAEMGEYILRIGDLDRTECRKDVETRFSTDRMVREHLELFDQVLASRP